MSQVPQTSQTLLTVSEAVQSRHSCRKFSSKDVSLDLLTKILDDARYTPSSMNLQPWKIYVISGETKEKLSSIILNKFDHGIFPELPFQFPLLPGGYTPMESKKFAQQFPSFAARYKALGKAVYGAQGIKRDDMEGRMKAISKAFEWFGAPIGLLVTLDKDCGAVQYGDTGMVVQTIMLLCQQYGLSTCCLGAWSLYHNTIRQTLNINDNETIYVGMAIGYKDETATINQVRSERMTLNEIVSFPQIRDDLEIKPISKLDEVQHKAKLIGFVLQRNTMFKVCCGILGSIGIYSIYKKVS